MIDEVDIVFNFGGTWVISPKLVYNKCLVQTWYAHNPNLLSFKDILGEFTDKLGFMGVKQLLVIGPSGRYFLVEGDDGIKTLQSLVSNEFRVLQFFAVDEHEVTLFAQNITQHSEIYGVDVDVGTDQEYCEGDEFLSDSSYSDYDEDKLEGFALERRRVVTDRLEKYKEIEVGMTFKDIVEARQVMSFYAMANHKKLKIKKTDKTRAIYECQEDCPFRCHISRDGKSMCFKIKTLKSEHSCDESFDNPLAAASTLAHYFKTKVQGDPKYKIKDMKGQLEACLKLNVSKCKLKRAKKLVLEKLEGSYRDDYNKLEAYGQELRLSNPGTNVVVNISRDALEQERVRKFLRMYICFQALKEGWKSGLRPLIGLDGTFLKGKCQGQLLVAIGQDSMNSFYPLAWAVVDKETKWTWRWFIENLKASLELNSGHGVTFISDMQKGLLEAVRTVLPDAHHRYCVRHIEANWCKRWRSGEMKKYMWWCAWSSYEQEFIDQLNKLGELDEKAAEDLVKYPPQAWCRAYFDTQCKNLMVDNNFTESFNNWILEARRKPIIKLLEDIRVKVMGLLAKNEEKVRKWNGDISPGCKKLYNDYRSISHTCQLEFNGDNGYEITEGEDRHTVNLEEKRCTCRIWDLSGIPCPHAIKALMHKKIDPLTEVHWWYTREAYMLTYKVKMQPVRGRNFWKVNPSQAMEPPTIVSKVGRPKIKRNRAPDEARLRKGAWCALRKNSVMSCSNCGEHNHNSRTCPSDHIVRESSRSSKRKRGSQIGQESGGQSSYSTVNEDSQLDTPSQQSTAYGPEAEFEEDPELRPMVVSETQTWLEMRKLQRPATGTRKISFVGDATGVSTPTNLPYTPRGLSWNGVEATTLRQLQGQLRTTRIKQMARRSQGQTSASPSNLA